MLQYFKKLMFPLQKIAVYFLSFEAYDLVNMSVIRFSFYVQHKEMNQKTNQFYNDNIPCKQSIFYYFTNKEEEIESSLWSCPSPNFWASHFSLQSPNQLLQHRHWFFRETDRQHWFYWVYECKMALCNSQRGSALCDSCVRKNITST